jgi:DNA-directed RNA polymerase subunit RPC12/RpoP
VYSLHISNVVILPLLPVFLGESELSEMSVEGQGKTEQMLVSELDLTKIQGNGDFPCPNCGVTISPEDETEEVYTVLEEKLKGEVLEELVIQCNKCSSRIRLTGFSFLEMANL